MLEDLAEQRSRVDGTLVAKKARLAVYDAASGRIARALESLYDLAGLDFYADRVRPTRRRKPRTAQDAAGTAPPAPPDPAEGAGR